MMNFNPLATFVRFLIRPPVVDKFVGCLLGGLVGDCIGDPFENEYSQKPVSVKEITQYISTLPGIGEKHYTDDTEMARCISESLIQNNAFDAFNCANRFLKEYNKPTQRLRNYGGSVHTVFRKWAQGCEDILEPAREQFNGLGSFGNGAPMRVAPVALFCYDNIEATVQMAKDTSRLTHTQIEAVHGSVLQSLAVLQALHASTEHPINVQSFVDNLMCYMEHEESTHYGPDSKLPYCDKLKSIKTLLDQETVSSQEVIDTLGNGIAAKDAVPIALFAFLRAQKNDIPGINIENQFERTIVYAISLGGDTDTIAAMTGGIAGAYLGATAIPSNLYENLEGHKAIRQNGEKLHQLVSQRMIGTSSCL